MVKECSNYSTIALISHTSKIMLKILQARLQQYVNCELPDVQAGFIYFFQLQCKLFFFLLYNIVLVLPYISMNPPRRCTCVSHPEPPSQLPHPSVPASSILYPASNLDWPFVSCMILYMFQCHSPKSSHLFSLPQSPKPVLYICVSFAVSHTGLSLPSFKIPYICVSILY